jgi:8-oxo-dGTP pyrophosphatase MutT (NUDIX family)
MMVILTNYLKTINISVSDKTDSMIIKSLGDLELAYWKYLDYYKPKESPPISFQDFVINYIKTRGIQWNKDQIKKYINIFHKYQKNIPTAGGIIYNDQGQVLLVKVYNSELYGFPKGKMDENDSDISETAIREIREETGIDVGKLISNQSDYIKINRTTLYLIKNCPVKTFRGYNEYEIIDIGWHSIQDIIIFPEKYTKQVKTYAKGLDEYSNKMIKWN